MTLLLWIWLGNVITLEPFDIQVESNPKTYFSSIDQIEFEDDLLYIRSLEIPNIFVFDCHGNFVEQIGKPGHGPGENGHGISAFSVQNKRLALISDTGKAYIYDFNQFITEINCGFPLVRNYATSNTFAVDSNNILISPAFSGKELAKLISLDGLVRDIPLDAKYEKEDYLTNPWFQECFWLFDGLGWIGVYKFQPIVVILDSNLKLKDRFFLDYPLFNDIVGRHLDKKDSRDFIWGKRKFKGPETICTDAKFFNGKLYILKEKFLIEVNLQSRTITNVSTFKIDALDNLGELAFTVFDFDCNGNLILGHKLMLWEHDLWIADHQKLKEIN